jgi:hypothetical protein
MGSRRIILGAGACVVAMLGTALFGCGDDSTTSTSTVLAGANYEAAQAEANDMVDSTLTVIQRGLILVVRTDAGVDPGDLNQTAELFYGGSLPDMSGGFVGEWLVMYGSDVSSAGTRYYVDSMAFWSGTQSLDGSAGSDHFELRHLSQFSVTDTNTSFTSYRNTGTFEFLDVDTDQAKVGASVQVSAQYKSVGEQDTQWTFHNLNFSVTNLVFDDNVASWGEACPSSGQISGSVERIVTTSEVTADTISYQFDATVDDGVATVQVVSGIRSATYDFELCTSGN